MRFSCFRSKWITGVLVLVLVAVVSGEKSVADQKNPFTDYGAPAKVSSVFSYASGIDSEGNPLFFQARGQAPEPFFLIVTRMDTGVSKQYPASGSAANYPWGMCFASNGKLYIGSCTDGHMFEFDPKTDVFRDLGRPSESETYIWQLTEGTDGKIYGCTYGNCKLVSYDPKTGKLADHGRADESEDYLRTIGADKYGYIYAGVGTSRANLVAYEIATGKFTKLIPESERAVGTGLVFKGADGRCYATCMTRSGNKSYLLKKGQAIEIPSESVPRRAPITFSDGRVFESLSETEILVKDPKTEVISRIPYKQDPAGTSLFALTTGPDNKVYISSVLPLYICLLDPETGKTENLGVGCYGAEVYSFLNMGANLWMAAYTGCAVARYDTSKPWKISTGSDSNPLRLHSQSRYAHRPITMCPAPDGKNILIGGVPDYGLLGGSIVVFDPEMLKVEKEYRDVIPNQSILSLCLTPDGFVCGGSGIGGGGGSHPTEKEARLFLWDYTKREKIYETVPVPGSGSITDLKQGPDGLIYGLSGEWLIVFDSKARKVVHTEKLPYGRPCLNAMALTPNGKFIALLGSNIVEITPGTFRHRSLAKYDRGITAGIAIVKDKVYFGSKSHVIGFDLGKL